MVCGNNIPKCSSLVKDCPQYLAERQKRARNGVKWVDVRAEHHFGGEGVEEESELSTIANTSWSLGMEASSSPGLQESRRRRSTVSKSPVRLSPCYAVVRIAYAFLRSIEKAAAIGARVEPGTFNWAGLRGGRVEKAGRLVFWACR